MHQNIVQLQVEAIVNAANGRLNHGAGIARAIANDAGKRWEEECHDLVKEKFGGKSFIYETVNLPPPQ